MITSAAATSKAAQGQHAVTRARFGEAAGTRLGADRDGGDSIDGNGGAECHHEGRDHPGPEQTLREREDEYDDGAGARSRADCNDSGEPALPPAWACELLGLGRMAMAPGRCMVLMIAVSVVAVSMTIVVVMVMTAVVLVVVVVVVMVSVIMIIEGRMIGRRDSGCCFDHVDGILHRRCSGVKKGRGDADQYHRD
jgi:hypothetical protein